MQKDSDNSTKPRLGLKVWFAIVWLALALILMILLIVVTLTGTASTPLS